MNEIVYTITDPDDEEMSAADSIRQFNWDELYLIISPNKKPSIRDRVLWVVEMGGVYGWIDLKHEMITGEIVPYELLKDLPVEAKKRFIEACFKEV